MGMRNKLAFWDCKFKTKGSLLGHFMPHNFSSSVWQSFDVILFLGKIKERKQQKKEGIKDGWKVETWWSP